MKTKRFLLCIPLLVVPFLFGCNKNNEPTKYDYEWIIYPDEKEEKTQKSNSHSLGKTMHQFQSCLLNG